MRTDISKIHEKPDIRISLPVIRYMAAELQRLLIPANGELQPLL